MSAVLGLVIAVGAAGHAGWQAIRGALFGVTRSARSFQTVAKQDDPRAFWYVEAANAVGFVGLSILIGWLLFHWTEYSGL